MSKRFPYCFILIGVTTFTLGCSNSKISKIKNSSFELGSIDYWKASGEAFSNECISFDFKSEENERIDYEGDFFLYGRKAPLGSTGVLESNKFKLSGNGKIGFLIGAGKNYDDCYVELIDSTGNLIDRRGNYEFKDNELMDNLHRVILDGSDYIGKICKIRIVDNDSNTDGFNYLNLDDFILGYEGSEEQVGKVFEATNYMNLNKESIDKRYYPTYHAASPVGWANDPNGLSYFNGKYNLFFQYNPYNTVWGPMHWGHYTTTDFIKWKLEPVALAPDMPYDNEFGAFSGSAIEKDGLLYAMYTGVANGLQQQCIATSKDGINFEKLTRNPVLSEKQLPNDFQKADFRDPYIFLSNGIYYVLLGSKNKNNKGTLLMYKSKDLKSWNFVGEVLNTTKPNEKNYLSIDGVFECPSYANIGGKEVLICSPQFLAKDGISHQNIHSVVYMIGQFDYQTGKFKYDELHDLDSGFDFYAAQILNAPDGRNIMIAWMQMWDRTMPTQANGWAGAFTLPRQLSIKDNHLYQNPVAEIENYRFDKVSYQNEIVSSVKPLSLSNISGKSIELEFTLKVGSSKKAGVKLFKGSKNETLLYYDSIKEEVVIDRSKSGVSINGKEDNNATRSAKVKLNNGTIKMRVFLDVSTIEVFINDGYTTLSTNVYPDFNDDGIEFYSLGGDAFLNEVTKYNIKTI